MSLLAEQEKKATNFITERHENIETKTSVTDIRLRPYAAGSGLYSTVSSNYIGHYRICVKTSPSTIPKTRFTICNF